MKRKKKNRRFTLIILLIFVVSIIFPFVSDYVGTGNDETISFFSLSIK